MRTEDGGSDLTDLWRDLVRTEARFYQARMALLAAVGDLGDIVDQALLDPVERGTALRLLLVLEEPRRRPFLPTLIDLAFTVHRDYDLVREVVRSLDRDWLAGQLDQIVAWYLGRRGPPSTQERPGLVSFLAELDPGLGEAFSARD